MTQENDIVKKRSEEIEKLVDAGKADEAKALIKTFLDEEPDNIDAHAWAGSLDFADEKCLEHLTFVFDRDITYDGPYRSYSKIGEARELFLMTLSMKAHDCYRIKEEAEAKREERRKYGLFADYAGRFLAAGKGLRHLSDFSEALLAVDRYDDVINCAYYITGNVSAKELGWPGLDYCKDRYSNPVDDILTDAMDAFFLSGRHADGCQWILDRICNRDGKKRDQDEDYYLWYLLGQSLCCLGWPEECARAWIVSVKKGFRAFDMDMNFETLSTLVVNPEYPVRKKIMDRLDKLEKLIPEEKKDDYQDIKFQLSKALRNRDAQMPTEQYIENKLGHRLPPYVNKRFTLREQRIILPDKKSAEPVVNKAIAAIDTHADIHYKEEKNDAVSRWYKRERVAVGDQVEPKSGRTLERFGIDLTEQAAAGDMPPVVGRDREIERMVRILIRAEKNNPVLLGEAGVGKTAVVQGLAQRIVRGDIPGTLKGKKVIELNVGVLVAGTTYRGDFEKRMTNIVNETKENTDIILFIDELHTLMGAGTASRRDLDGSNILKPALAAGDLRLIGATTGNEFSRYIEKDPAMERRFSPVWLNEIDRETVLAVLEARKSLWEKHHRVSIDNDVFMAAIQLTDQHIRYLHFPDKAIDAVDEACALARTGHDNGKETVCRVTGDNIKQVVDEWIGAGREKVPAVNTSYCNDIRAKLGEKIIGHKIILDNLASIIVDEKIGLRRSKLPRILCFAGPAGIGKAKTAEAMAGILWPDEKERFLFVNMAILSSEADLNYLLGASRNYVGGDRPGLLPFHLKQHPHSLVFLYQFHKCHPRIMRFFGNLFTEGCFVEPKGQTMYVGSTLFVLSITFETVAQSMGFTPHDTSESPSKSSEQIIDFLKRNQVPESIVHSVGEFFSFASLSETEVRHLVTRRFSEVINQPGIRGLKLTQSKESVERLVKTYLSLSPHSRDLKTLFSGDIYTEIACCL